MGRGILGQKSARSCQNGHFLLFGQKRERGVVRTELVFIIILGLGRKPSPHIAGKGKLGVWSKSPGGMSTTKITFEYLGLEQWFNWKGILDRPKDHSVWCLRVRSLEEGNWSFWRRRDKVGGLTPGGACLPSGSTPPTA